MSRQVTSFGRIRGLDAFEQSARGLGDALGPLRIKVQQARDDGFLRLLLDSLDPDLQVALDFRHESWDDPEITARLDEHRVARVDAPESTAPFRYLRLREPPYEDDDLGRIAADIRPLLDEGIDVYAYFRHEDEPTAPRYAEKLLELV
jgi:uncharacterized protein YecE (DUF72 family)